MQCIWQTSTRVIIRDFAPFPAGYVQHNETDYRKYEPHFYSGKKKREIKFCSTLVVAYYAFHVRLFNHSSRYLICLFVCLFHKILCVIWFRSVRFHLFVNCCSTDIFCSVYIYWYSSIFHTNWTGYNRNLSNLNYFYWMEKTKNNHKKYSIHAETFGISLSIALADSRGWWPNDRRCCIVADSTGR